MLYLEIKKKALAYAIAQVDETIIDKINILQASLLSMKLAVEKLKIRPSFLLIDGNFEIHSTIPQKAIIKGDSLSISIAAASILAKVKRDKIMKNFDEIYPEYGFKNHKGYPTKKHREAITKFGRCKIHRKSFKVKKVFF